MIDIVMRTIKKYYKQLDKHMIFDFLHGLKRELGEVHGRILSTKPLPNIRDFCLGSK